MRDAPRKNARLYRKEEWIAYGMAPHIVDRVARRHTRGRYFVCSVLDRDESADVQRAEYRRLGYRLLAEEAFFVHPLRRIPRAAAPVKLVRIRTVALAEQFGKATRSRPIRRDQLGEKASFRQYVAIDEGQIVGWVRSVDADRSSWCSQMYVKPSHRRRGIGRALLGKMLRDDRKLQKNRSVLLASRSGALLYPHVGYQQIGSLWIYAPGRVRETHR
jgi:GNAT superfamily N-acetyltransferase